MFEKVCHFFEKFPSFQKRKKKQISSNARRPMIYRGGGRGKSWVSSSVPCNRSESGYSSAILCYFYPNDIALKTSWDDTSKGIMDAQSRASLNTLDTVVWGVKGDRMEVRNVS